MGLGNDTVGTQSLRFSYCFSVVSGFGMAVLHVSFNTEPYLLAEVRVSETSEPTDGTFVGDMSF